MAAAFVERRIRRAQFDAIFVDDDEPLAAYVILGLCDTVCALNDEEVRDVVRHVSQRCATGTPRQRAKALKALKKLVERVGGRAIRECAKYEKELRACAQFTGVEDERRGDALNEAVRASAREVLAAAFSRDGVARGAKENGAVLASASSSHAIACERGQCGEYDDVVDDAFYAFRTTPRKGEKQREGVLEAPLEASLARSPRLNVDEKSGTKWRPVDFDKHAKERLSKDATFSDRASSASATSSARDVSSSFASERPRDRSPTTPTAAPTSIIAKHQGLGEEARAVDALCAPMGVRLAPIDGDIDRFLRDGANGGFDAGSVVAALAEKMLTYADDDWKSAFRAACVLEYASRMPPHSSAWLVDAFTNSSAMELLRELAKNADASAPPPLRQKCSDAFAALTRATNKGNGVECVDDLIPGFVATSLDRAREPAKAPPSAVLDFMS